MNVKTVEAELGYGVEDMNAEVHAVNIATIIARMSANYHAGHAGPAIDIAIKAYWQYIADINENMNKLIPDEKGESEREPIDGKTVC